MILEEVVRIDSNSIGSMMREEEAENKLKWI